MRVQQRMAQRFLVAGVVAAAGWMNGQAQAQKELAAINAPIQRISGDNRSYTVYFQAWSLMNISDPRTPAHDVVLTPGTKRYSDVLAWAGEAAQQAAVKALLERGAGGVNATERKSFGMPYGTKDVQGVSSDMAAADFVVYVDGERLWGPEFAYFPAFDDVASLLHAEAYRRAEAKEYEGAIAALIGSCRMYRQMCDRAYIAEVDRGFARLSDRVADVRAFMWYFRDALSVDQFKTIALELARLDVDLIGLPTAERICGEQLVEQLYGADNRPKNEPFARTMAALEAQKDPLAQFERAAVWNMIVDKQAAKDEARAKVIALSDDWNRRWRLRSYDPQLATLRTEFEKTDPVSFALPLAILTQPQELFEARFYLRAQLNGSVTSAGLCAWQKRENGKLVEGEKAMGAPQRLSQIQPIFVEEEASMTDPYDINYRAMRYTIIRKTDKDLAWQPYEVVLEHRTVQIPEGWPFLYSVGPDRFDESGKRQLQMSGGDFVTARGDLIFWPPVDLLK